MHRHARTDQRAPCTPGQSTAGACRHTKVWIRGSTSASTQDGQVQREFASPLTADDAYWAALLAAAELIRGGVTGFGDHYFFMDAVARATVESGLRANLAWCTFGGDEGEIGGDIAAVAAFAESVARCGRRPDQDLARTAFSVSLLAAIPGADRCRRGPPGRRDPLRAAESQEQVDFSTLAYDMTPIEVLDKNGVLDVPVDPRQRGVPEGRRHRDPGGARRCPSWPARCAQRAAGLAAVSNRGAAAAGVAVGLGTDGAGPVASARYVRGRCARRGDQPGRHVLRCELTALRLATGAAAGAGLRAERTPGAGLHGRPDPDRRPRAAPAPLHDPVAVVADGRGRAMSSDVMVGGRVADAGGAVDHDRRGAGAGRDGQVARRDSPGIVSKYGDFFDSQPVWA